MHGEQSSGTQAHMSSYELCSVHASPVSTFPGGAGYGLYPVAVSCHQACLTAPSWEDTIFFNVLNFIYFYFVCGFVCGYVCPPWACLTPTGDRRGSQIIWNCEPSCRQ